MLECLMNRSKNKRLEMKIALFFIMFISIITSNTDTSIKKNNKPHYPDLMEKYKSTKERDIYLHIFFPKKIYESKAEYPTLVFFHGGGWKGGKPRMFYKLCDYFSNNGFECIAVEYRTGNNSGTGPREAIEDAKSAIRYIRMHAKSLMIDPNKLIVGGSSAGGHLALTTVFEKNINAVDDNLSISPIPNALVLYNPIIDTSIDGYGYKTVKNYWKDISPLHNIYKRFPPTVIFLGTKDRLVPLSTAERFCKKIKSKSGKCTLILYSNAKHSFFYKKKFYKNVRDKTELFINSLFK